MIHIILVLRRLLFLLWLLISSSVNIIVGVVLSSQSALHDRFKQLLIHVRNMVHELTVDLVSIGICLTHGVGFEDVWLLNFLIFYGRRKNCVIKQLKDMLIV